MNRITLLEPFGLLVWLAHDAIRSPRTYKVAQAFTVGVVVGGAAVWGWA